MSRAPTPQFDISVAHRHFSADCFNRTWTLIEKADRTADDNEAMILCALASLWHWTQRPDCTDVNLSVGHWQVSRVYALAGQGDNAMRHAGRSLALAAGASSFYIGYAHEAVARAAALLGDETTFQSHLAEARKCAAAVADASERATLERELRDLAVVRG